jgi:tetratricopeptide (TPR) repeat protein
MADRSVVGRDVSQSIAVTGDGNTVTLTFGDSGVVLPLRRRQFRPADRRRRSPSGQPPRELDLLVPEAGKLPLIGRKDLFAELQAWIDDEVDISVHALIGRAGSGKTRLALEFCAKIDSDPNAKGGWLAGFLSPIELSSVVETLTTRHFVWERSTLLVIDYAAQCHEALGRWLDRLASQKLDTQLRILLLDREAPEGFGWWRELTGSGLNTALERRDLFYSLRPRQLPDLSDLDERRELMKSALQGARDLRSVPSDALQIPPAGEDQDFDEALAQPQFGNPLALVMAGVIALDQGPRAALALRHLEAARRIGHRELGRFAALAQTRGVSRDVICHIVAYNELADGIPIAELRESVAKELATRARSADADVILPLLQQELPPRTGAEQAARGPRLATLQPDLIGEAAIIEAFTGEPSREWEADKIVARAYALGGEKAARVLVRLLQDFAYALEDESATEKEKPAARRLMTWLLTLSQQVQDPEHLLPLVDALPAHTTILREPAAELTERLAVLFRQEAERTNDPIGWIRAAALLNNLANRLSDLGRREEALATADTGVRLYRALVAAHPDALTHLLARSPNNLANRLGDLGQLEQAQAAAEESVHLLRSLASTRHDAFAPDLALSLTNLASTLSELGRHKEALTTGEKAVRLYRALVTTRPDTFTPNLAASLNNFATLLSKLGRPEEALIAAKEAVRLLHDLARTQPDAFTPALAGSLNNVANRLSDLGRHEEALTMAEEATGFYRVLAASRPNAFTPNLAGSFNNLARILSKFDRREEAQVALEEAVCCYRALAAARPDVFNPYLAGSLNNLANNLRDLGRRKDAVMAAEGAVRLRRALYVTCPEAFAIDFARSLLVLGGLYGETGKSDPAIDTLAEGLCLLRPIFVSIPAAVTGIMRGLVQSYLAQCEAAGREPDDELLGPVIAELEHLKRERGKEMSGSNDNRSVTARDITASSVVTGDHNTVMTTMGQVAVAPADEVDAKAELAALRELLVGLKNVPDRGRLDRAMEDAVEETAKPEPDKEWVGNALERVAKSAKAASDFSENAEKIVPRLVALGSWLGPAGRAVLNVLGVPV